MFFALFTLGYALAQNTISIRIDDSELYTPANQNGIQYSSSWVQHSGNEAKGQYRGTFSSTSTANASAIFFFQGLTFFFKFFGRDGTQSYRELGVILLRVWERLCFYRWTSGPTNERVTVDRIGSRR